MNKSVDPEVYDHEDKPGAGAKKRKHLKGKDKVEVVMGEYKRGTLRSGSGKKVTKRSQALAIAMSEAGMGKSMDDMLGVCEMMKSEYWAQDILEKAKKMAVGTTADWGGKQYKKVSEGVWKPVGGEHPGGGAPANEKKPGEKELKGSKELHDKFMEVISGMTDAGRQAFRGGKFDYENKRFTTANGKHALEYRDGEVGLVTLKKSLLGRMLMIKSGSHKYIKRTGTKGKYRYWYQEDMKQGKKKKSDSDPDEKKKVDHQKIAGAIEGAARGAGKAAEALARGNAADAGAAAAGEASAGLKKKYKHISDDDFMEHARNAVYDLDKKKLRQIARDQELTGDIDWSSQESASSDVWDLVFKSSWQNGDRDELIDLLEGYDVPVNAPSKEQYEIQKQEKKQQQKNMKMISDFFTENKKNLKGMKDQVKIIKEAMDLGWTPKSLKEYTADAKETMEQMYMDDWKHVMYDANEKYANAMIDKAAKSKGSKLTSKEKQEIMTDAVEEQWKIAKKYIIDVEPPQPEEITFAISADAEEFMENYWKD